MGLAGRSELLQVQSAQYTHGPELFASAAGPHVPLHHSQLSQGQQDKPCLAPCAPGHGRKGFAPAPAAAQPQLGHTTGSSTPEPRLLASATLHAPGSAGWTRSTWETRLSRGHRSLPSGLTELLLRKGSTKFWRVRGKKPKRYR